MIGLISLLKEIQGKPKAIFMAGPAGSGKSFISKKLVPSNFTTINVDDTYEELLKSSGIGMKLANMSPDELKKSGDLIEALTQKVGRILLNGFPTGVEVSGAMVHGGPFPSTTDSRSTSVGTQAIYRFTRPVCFQNFSSEMIP